MTSGIFASVDAIAALVMGVVIPATGLRVRLGDPNYGFAQGQNRRNRDCCWDGGVASGSFNKGELHVPLLESMARATDCAAATRLECNVEFCDEGFSDRNCFS